MKFLLGLIKFLVLAAAAAVAMGLFGLAVAAIVAPIIIPGNNPHTDLLGRLGIAYLGTFGGAALGVLGVVGWTAYKSLKKHRAQTEGMT